MSLNHHRPTRECASLAALLPLAAHHLLTEQEAARLQAHLATCAHCQAEAALDTQVEAALRRSYALPKDGSPLLSREEITALLSAGGRAVRASGSESADARRRLAQAEGPAAPPVIPEAPARSTRRVGGLAALAVTLAVILLVVAIFGIPGLLPHQHKSAAPTAPAPLSIYVSEAGSSQPYSVFALDASTGKPRWQYQTSAQPQPQPFLFENVVYFGSADGSISALNASTGKRLWSVKLPTAGDPAVQAAENGLIYVVFLDCYYFGFTGECPSIQPGGPLLALHASTGKTAWQSQEALNVVQATPDALYVTSGLTIFALNLTTGTERWHFNADGPAGTTQGYYNPVQVINGQVYAFALFLNTSGLNGTGFYDLNANDGTLAWRYLSPDMEESFFFAAIANGTVYLTDSTLAPVSPPAVGPQNEVLAFNASDGTLKWRYQRGGLTNVNSVVASNGSVYIAFDYGILVSLSEQDGSFQWQSRSLSNSGFYLTLADNENLYAIPYDNQYNREGVLLALSNKDGSTLWTFPKETVTGESSSLSVLKVIDGVLYGSVSGQPNSGVSSSVFALNTTDGSQRWTYDAGLAPINPAIG